MNMRIDTEATRNRIQAMAGRNELSSAQPQVRASYGYRDNDMQPRGIMNTQPTELQLAQMPDEYNCALEGGSAGGFTDLDSLPLTFGSAPEQSASHPDSRLSPPVPDSVESSSSGSEPVSFSPALPGAESVFENEDAPLVLDPPRMRRIIFLATTSPGDIPPFAKTQPNLGGVGLRYGLGRFAQLSGDLGRLLLAMRDTDPVTFDRIFGSDADFPDASAEELIAVTTALNSPGAAADAAQNMQSVSGKPLWAPEWLRKFKAASKHAPFQDAQFFTAAQTALLPMLEFARDLGLDSEKGITLLTERAIQQGVSAAKEFIIAAAGPINTEALKREALVHLADDPNSATLSAFQAVHGLPDTAGRLDAVTHAALVGALRARGDSPIPLPSQVMMFDLITRAAEKSSVPGLIAAIRGNGNLSEAPLSAAEPEME